MCIRHKILVHVDYYYMYSHFGRHLVWYMIHRKESSTTLLYVIYSYTLTIDCLFITSNSHHGDTLFNFQFCLKRAENQKARFLQDTLC